MKRYYITIILCSVLLFINKQNFAQSSTTATMTRNGKTLTATAFANNLNDTSKWKTREISKDFPIGANTPIYVESAYRNIEIKTWDQPNVRIVANARYKNNIDTNKNFDEIFEKIGISIKNSNDAFEILGTSNNRDFSHLHTFSFSNNIPDEPKNNNFIIDPALHSLTISGDSTTTITDTFFLNNNIKISFLQQEEEKQMAKAIAMDQIINASIKEHNKKISEKEKVKMETLSKQIEAKSKQIAELTLKNADKNNKEITKLSQEISKISNQIAFQSMGNIINFQLDSIKSYTNTITPTLMLNFENNHALEPIIPTNTNALNWVIYIPQNHKISIDSKYGNIQLDNDIASAKIDSKYGNIETKNIDNLIVRNEYGNIYTGNIKDGSVEIRSGKLKIGNADNIKIDSKNANIDMDEVGNIKVESSNDNYDISSIHELNANKNYGTFRLTTLNGKMIFNGVNADIKIRNISTNATNIDITNKFAKIALPFSDIHNYNIAVNGNYNSSFDDFNKKGNNDKGFTAASGNAKDLTTNINCNNCQLDFK